MKYQDLSTIQRLSARTNFIGFLKREGWTEVQARNELDYLLANNQQVTQEHYTTRVRRVGATKTLNRSDRFNVYLTLQSAINHALWSE